MSMAGFDVLWVIDTMIRLHWYTFLRGNAQSFENNTLENPYEWSMQSKKCIKEPDRNVRMKRQDVKYP